MKIALFFVFFILFFGQLFSQDCDLSPEAKRYWLRAEAAMESISAEEDYLLAATELENVLHYAPNCADALYNLGVVYSQIGMRQGDAAFIKAEQYLNRYMQLNPSGKQDAEDLLVKLEFKREKYRKDEVEKKKQELLAFEGTWDTDKYYQEAIKIEIKGDEISITPIPKNKYGERIYTDKNVKGFYSNGVLTFSYKRIYYDNEGSYDRYKYYDSHSIITYKLSLPINGEIKDVLMIWSQRQDYYQGKLIGIFNNDITIDDFSMHRIK